MRWSRIKNSVAYALPRLESIVWGIFALATSWAYVDKEPPQLQPAMEMLPIQMWHAWVFAGVLLIVGALVPHHAGEKQRRIARIMRVVGISIVCGLMVLWAGAFFQSDQRGWVSGKNYLMFALLGLLSAFTIGKDTATGIHEQVDGD